MKKIINIIVIILVLLITPIGIEAKDKKKVKEEYKNVICLRVERIFEENKRKVNCSNRDRSYLLKIRDGNIETYSIDFNIAALVFYNSVQAVPLIKPTDVTIINTYHESKRYTYKELENTFKDISNNKQKDK